MQRSLEVLARRLCFPRHGKSLDDLDLLRQEIHVVAERQRFCLAGSGWHSFHQRNLTCIREEGATAIGTQAMAGYP